MLSGIRLSRPWVRRHAIVTDLLITKHPSENTYSAQFPILANSLTYCSATIIINRPIGRLGKPMRVVVRLRDPDGYVAQARLPLRYPIAVSGRCASACAAKGVSTVVICAF